MHQMQEAVLPTIRDVNLITAQSMVKDKLTYPGHGTEKGRSVFIKKY
jgi:hypothetical protein